MIINEGREAEEKSNAMSKLAPMQAAN